MQTLARTQCSLLAFSGRTANVRRIAHGRVIHVLEILGLSDAVRGSWKYGDFHLSQDGSSTQSDLDLVVQHATNDEKSAISSSIHTLLSPTLDVRVSVHAADSLLAMDLKDSFVLNMGEFLSKVAGQTEHPESRDYVMAKIVLLLLRCNPAERYSQVAARLGTPDAILAIRVKLGVRVKLPRSAALRLVANSDHPVVAEFQRTCVRQDNWVDAASYVRSNIGNCPTIADWLRNYLLSKLSDTGL